MFFVVPFKIYLKKRKKAHTRIQLQCVDGSGQRLLVNSHYCASPHVSIQDGQNPQSPDQTNKQTNKQTYFFQFLVK